MATTVPLNKIKVLLLENIHSEAEAYFVDRGFDVTRLSHALSEEELIEKAVSPFDVHDLKSEMAARPDPEALKTCLFQECDRYNVLFTKVKQSLVALAKGIQGLVVITSELQVDFCREAWNIHLHKIQLV